MRIIAAIDIIDGKCIRLHKGDYAQKIVYNENPLEVAKQFEDAGLKYLHLVDLDGAKKGKIIHYNILEKIVSRTTLQVDFSGGITNDEMIKIAFECGASQVTIGTIAVKNPDILVHWLNKYGADKIILAADVKNEKIYIYGWQEETKLYIYDFIANYTEKGIKYIMCTDITKDGTMQGASAGLYKNIKGQFKDINLIASGGIASMKDVEDCFNAGCEGVIIGKAIYENKIKITDLVKLTT